MQVQICTHTLRYYYYTVIDKLGEFIHIFKEAGSDMRKLQTNLSRRQRYTNFPDRWDKKAIPINKNSLEN